MRLGCLGRVLGSIKTILMCLGIVAVLWFIISKVGSCGNLGGLIPGR